MSDCYWTDNTNYPVPYYPYGGEYIYPHIPWKPYEKPYVFPKQDQEQINQRIQQLQEMLRIAREEADRERRRARRRVNMNKKKKDQERRVEIAMFLAMLPPTPRSLFRTYLANPKDIGVKDALIDALKEADLDELAELIGEGWML